MKKLLTLALVGLLATGLTACSAKNDTLMIYSNSVGMGRGDWLVEQAAEAGFTVEYADIKGGDLTNRLLAEKDSSLADVVFGLNAMDFANIKSEDILLKYEPEWADEVDMTLGDAEGYFYPIVTQPIVLAMNNEMDSYPTDWLDLSTGQFNGMYNVLGLHGGTSRAILCGILTRYTDPNGELGISEEGWEMCKGYVQNGILEVKGDDFIGNLINGSIPMSGLWGSGVIQYQDERDYKFEVMSPEIGVPFVTEQVAIIKNTKKAELAEDFINWFGSAEVQGAWTQEFGSMPVHPDALAMASDEVKAFSEHVHPQDIDWEFCAANIGSWAEKIELEFVQ